MQKIYKKDINKLMPILQALAGDKTIQFAATDKEWIDIDSDEDGLSLETLINNPQAYRIKPEIKYYPFASAKECWQEMLEHYPFGWVKDMDGNKFIIETINSDGSIYVGEEGTYCFSEALENYTFDDGIPFGVKEEE